MDDDFYGDKYRAPKMGGPFELAILLGAVIGLTIGLWSIFA